MAGEDCEDCTNGVHREAGGKDPLAGDQRDCRIALREEELRDDRGPVAVECEILFLNHVAEYAGSDNAGQLPLREGASLHPSRRRPGLLAILLLSRAPLIAGHVDDGHRAGKRRFDQALTAFGSSWRSCLGVLA